MQLNSEVLPAPLGPTSPKIWPGSTAKLTSCSTLMPPNCRLTSCRVSSAAIDRSPAVAALLRCAGPGPSGERTKLPGDCQRFWCESRAPTVSTDPGSMGDILPATQPLRAVDVITIWSADPLAPWEHHGAGRDESGEAHEQA